MMESERKGDSCVCDPLKRVIQQFFFELSKDGVKDEMVNSLHLIYNSAVLRHSTKGQATDNLECRIGTEDTLKFLSEWLLLKNEGQEAERYQDNSFTGRLKEIKKTPPVKSVVADKFGNVTMELDSGAVTEQVIKWILTTGWSSYSMNPCHNQVYQVEVAMTSAKSTGDCSGSSFQEYRKILVAQTVSTILKKIGHNIDDAHFSQFAISENNKEKIQPNTILVAATPTDCTVIKSSSSESSWSGKDPEVVLRVNIGNVITKVSSVQEMLSKRLAEIKEICESRRSEPLSSWGTTSIDNLARATLHYDLLCRPLEKDIEMVSLSESRQRNSDALFIMYNYSRVVSIIKKFHQQVKSGEYPELPDVHEVDFSLICQQKEELHLLQLLMEWSRVMESAVSFVRFQVNLVAILKFLLALAKAFNSFYFQIVVLVPVNAPHNFSAMMSRVYLIKAICQVFEDCLEILQVDHVNSK